MNRVYNFSPGPATLPEEVLLQAQEELLDWQGLGLSVMEISHHSPEFKALAQTAEQDLRDLLNIPSNYKVLFMQGGGRAQFAMAPLNLLHGKTTADYVDIGIWSTMAINEANKYAKVNVVASNKDSQFTDIPDVSTWQRNPEAAYFHYVDNETINGIMFPEVPDIKDVSLVSDMSSSILSRQIDVSRFGLIYAAAQKNAGPAGVTLAIVREDLLGKALPVTPSVLNYTLYAEANSMYNTPPTFSWYLTGLVFKWLKKQGGVAEIEKINRRKAQILYEAIDASSFYQNAIDPRYRSYMNVIFSLDNAELDARFLAMAQSAGLVGLKGHKMFGGMRASIYNAMPEAGVVALVEFMKEFERIC